MRAKEFGFTCQELSFRCPGLDTPELLDHVIILPPQAGMVDTRLMDASLWTNIFYVLPWRNTWKMFSNIFKYLWYLRYLCMQLKLIGNFNKKKREESADKRNHKILHIKVYNNTFFTYFYLQSRLKHVQKSWQKDVQGGERCRLSLDHQTTEVKDQLTPTFSATLLFSASVSAEFSEREK